MKTQQKPGSLAKASRANRTKLVAVWHVEHSLHGEPKVRTAKSHGEAIFASTMLRAGMGALHITITGPHQHRVPA